MTRLCSPVIRARGKLRADCKDQGRKKARTACAAAAVLENVSDLGNAEQVAGELPTRVASGRDMCAQSYGGRETRASTFRIEQAEAANVGSRYLRRRSGIKNLVEVLCAAQQEEDSAGSDEVDLASELNSESSGDDCEGLSSSERALAVAVEAYGRLEDFEGEAAEFPGQTGDVGECGNIIFCEKCRNPEGPKPCLVCDECDRSFHVSCLRIRPKTAERYDEWLCDSCIRSNRRQRRPLGKVLLKARYKVNGLTGSQDRMSSQQGSSHENERSPRPGGDRIEDEKVDGGDVIVREIIKQNKLIESRMSNDVKSVKVEALPDGDGSVESLEQLGSSSDLHSEGKGDVKLHDNNGMITKFEPGRKVGPACLHVRSVGNAESPCTQEMLPTKNGGIGSDLSGDLPHSGIEDKDWDERIQNKDPLDSRAAYALEQLKTFVAENCGMVSLDGWTATVKDRAKEGRLGSVRTYFFSPEKKRFCSKQEVYRHFESLGNVSTPSGEEYGSSTCRVKTRSSSVTGCMSMQGNIVGELVTMREAAPGQEFQDNSVEKRSVGDQHDRLNNSSPCISSGRRVVQSASALGSPTTSPLPASYAEGGSKATGLCTDDPAQSEFKEGDVLGTSGEPILELKDQRKMTERELEAVVQLRRYVTERNGFLGKGWTADITPPKRGSVVCDVKYYSPDRKVFRSRAEVLRYLGLLDTNTEDPEEPNMTRVCAVLPDEERHKDVDKDAVLQQLKSFIAEKQGSLDEGWDVEVRRRTSCNATDKIYVSPDKQKFRSRLEVARFLGLDTSKGRGQGGLEKSNLQLPIQCGELSIESLGEVDKWTGGDGSTICPVGYRSTWHDVHTGSFCISEVADNGHSGRVFRVTRRSCAIFLGRRDGFGSCSGVQEHTAGWAGVSSDLKGEMGEFAIEASTSSEAWKALAERCAEWWKSRSETRIKPYSARTLEVNRAEWTVESENGHEVVVLGEDSGSEDESDRQQGCPREQAVGNDSGQVLSELIERLGQDRFGLTDEVVQNALKLLSGAKAQVEIHSPEDIRECGEPPSKHQGDLEQTGISLQVEEAGEVMLDSPVLVHGQTLPAGVTFGERLPGHLAGDVLEIWEFLCRFADVIQIQLPSFDDFEAGLVEQWELSYEDATADALRKRNDSVSSTGCVEQTTSKDYQPRKEFGNEIAQGSVNQPKGVDQVATRGITALANIHIPLIKLLISDMKQKILGIQSLDAEELKSKTGKKGTFEDEMLVDIERESCLPMNVITWPDVAHRYILALLALKREDEDPERRHQHYSRIFRLLQGDGGVLYGGLDGMAGAEADAQLLGDVEKELLKMMSPTGTVPGSSPVDPLVGGGLTEDSSVKSMVEQVGNLQKGEEKELWLQILEPVAQIPTNTGARIRNRVQEALKEGPPDWARKVLEWSITKEVFKGNAAGPTKHAVLSVLATVRGEEVKPRKCRVRARKIVPSPALITQRCRLVLREVAAADTSRVFCFLYGNGVFDANELEGDGSLKTTSGVVRPLDLRTIDLRLEAGVYLQSPEAFAADVRQIWKNAEVVYKDGSKMLRLSQKLSELFDELYEKQVTSLLQGGSVTKKRKDIPDEPQLLQPLALQGGKSGKKPVTNFEKPGGWNLKGQGNPCKESPEKSEGGELLKAPWDEESCRICGVDDDYDNVLLCDGCEAEYHTYCLKPPLTKVPEGKWFCPHCLALEKSFPERILEEGDPIEDQKAADYHQHALFEKSPLHALAERMDGREYWQLDITEMVFLLRTLCNEALDTSIVRANLDKCLDQSLELQQKLRLLIAERSQPRTLRIKNRELDDNRAIAVISESSQARVQTRAERLERRFKLDSQRGNIDSKIRTSSSRADEEGALKHALNDQVVDVKRKRGRPPKVRSADGDSLVSSPGQVPKRRGRPPKATMNVTEKRRGRPPKRKLEPNDEVPVKKRGRPPKKVSQSPPSVPDSILSPGMNSELDHKQRAIEVKALPNEEPMREMQSSRQVGQEEGVHLPSIQCSPGNREPVLDSVTNHERSAYEQGEARLEVVPDPEENKLHMPDEETSADDMLLINAVAVVRGKEQHMGVPSPATVQNKTVRKDTPKGHSLNDDHESDGGLSVDSAEEESNKQLDVEIEGLELEVMNMSLRREFIGRDNYGRQYWIVCGPGRKPQVAIEDQVPSHLGSSDVDTLMGRTDKVSSRTIRSCWILYETEAQLDELVGCLRYSKQERALRSSLAQWRKSLAARRMGTELHPGGKAGCQEDKHLGYSLSSRSMSLREEGNKVFFKGFPVLRATKILERRYGPFRTYESLVDSKIKGKVKRVESMYRCSCLEPVWAGRPHCKTCHETCVDEGEFMRHKCQDPGQATRSRKTKKQSTVSAMKPVKTGCESVGRKRKKGGYPSEEYFSNQFPENVLQGDLHRVTKLKVRKRHTGHILSGERIESIVPTGTDISREEIYGVSPEFQGTLSTPCDISGFRTGDSGEGAVLEIGGFADTIPANHDVEGLCEDFGLLGSSGISRRSARRKGIPQFSEQLEGSALKHSSRENLIHQIKLLSEDLGPDVDQERNMEPSSSTNSIGLGPLSAWGPHFNGSSMSSAMVDSTRERVLQIGCIADKGPTFAPALSFAPAFDPSLMMQSSSDDTFTKFPVGYNGRDSMTQPSSSFRTDVNLQVCGENFQASLFDTCNAEGPLYHGPDEGDDSGSIAASVIDFFSLPNLEDQGWTMEDHGRFAIDDGVGPAMTNYGNVSQGVLSGVEELPITRPAIDVHKTEDICLGINSPENVPVSGASEVIGRGGEARNIDSQEVYVPSSSCELDVPKSTMELADQEMLRGGTTCVGVTEYEPADLNEGGLPVISRSTPETPCTGDRSLKDTKCDGEPVNSDSNDCQPVNSGEGSLVYAAPLETPCNVTAPETLEQPWGETRVEVEIRQTDAELVEQEDKEGMACKGPVTGTTTGDRPLPEPTRRLNIPEASLRPLAGKQAFLLKWLKMNLLDVEAALTPGMLEPAKADGSRRRAWRSLVKSAKSLFEVTQALFVLELMIKSDCLRSSWGHWFSLSAVLKTANISSVALRLFALDIATSYEVGSIQPKKRGRKKKVRAEETDDVDD